MASCLGIWKGALFRGPWRKKDRGGPLCLIRYMLWVGGKWEFNLVFFNEEM